MTPSVNSSTYNLNILYFNARSIDYKLKYIITELQYYCPEIVCISETWLRDEEIPPGSFYDSDITLHFLRRQSRR